MSPVRGTNRKFTLFFSHLLYIGFNLHSVSVRSDCLFHEGVLLDTKHFVFVLLKKNTHNEVINMEKAVLWQKVFLLKVKHRCVLYLACLHLNESNYDRTYSFHVMRASALCSMTQNSF